MGDFLDDRPLNDFLDDRPPASGGGSILSWGNRRVGVGGIVLLWEKIFTPHNTSFASQPKNVFELTIIFSWTKHSRIKKKFYVEKVTYVLLSHDGLPCMQTRLLDKAIVERDR